VNQHTYTHDSANDRVDSASEQATMSTTLLTPPTTADPQTTLTLTNRAKYFLTAQRSWLSSLPYPFSLLLANDSQEKWQTYSNLFHAFLLSGQNNEAYLCLEELVDRFGKTNEHILALQGLYQEATAKDQKELEEVMRSYDEIIREDPTIFSIRKRRAALLKSVGRPADAIGDLVALLDASPTDAEAWAELGELYVEQGQWEQAVFCLEEVFLVTPNAWNMHARMGEVQYLWSQTLEGPEQVKVLSESMRRFCRSIELCDDYLRGYYGLKVTTARLAEVLDGGKKGQISRGDGETGELPTPDVKTVRKLNEVATAKLAEIVRRAGSSEKGWDGYNSAELKAAKELVGKDEQKIAR
jgi:ER membrane protein complex subunit 2